MHKAPVLCSDPQSALAIAEQPFGSERLHNTWERIRLGSTVNKSADCTADADQKGAVSVFPQTSDAVRLTRQRIKL